ncbi:type II secretion system protein GspM [Thiohalorhabdus denitrificans]|uniref:General secretion pathway protein M n=1 Tax=Thiohalorhabdus denitrificans TaxID=381306 RepID=A0A1G5DP47_9GAMM|nr:type II secretion system protein GspM [Thiohalorhabdus denitrificans]SCY16532.1 general secretion pathway protein M [Thiohalorhabdus denitrificans]
MLREWWRERPPRERAVLAGGGAALLLVLAYLLIEPHLAERQRLAREIPELREDLSWMREHVAEVKRLGGESAGPASGSVEGERSFGPALVEDSLRGAGLADEVETLRSSGDEGVQVAFTRVAFPELAGWLGDLRQRSGAKVRTARIQRNEEQEGVVEAELTLVPGEEP